MRLTLRTMLAYLDDVLDPEDAEQLGARINESEFASELVHRVRSSTRKMRLSAPELDGQGVGVELNSVAEYLDNTLAEEQSSDFEKVCLESDVHLAEVASCHQILTLVLGEPAVVPKDVRQRIYRVESEHEALRQAAQRKTANDGRSQSSSVTPPPFPVDQQTDENGLPEFMQPPRTVRLRYVGLMGVVAVSLLLLLPGVRAKLGWQAANPKMVVQQSGDPEIVENADGSSGVAREGSPRATLRSPAANGSSVDAVADADPVPGVEPVGSATSSLPAVPATVTTPARPPGKLISADQLLLRWHPQQHQWESVAVDAALETGDRLLVPPGFRPQVALASGLQMTVVGHSAWQWVATKSGPPRLVLAHGRFVFRGEAELPEPVTMNLADRQGWLQLPDKDSQVAMELWHYLPPGRDPRKGTAELATRIYQSAGGTWAQQQTELVNDKPAGVVVSRALGDQPLEQVTVTALPGWTAPVDVDATLEKDLAVVVAGLMTSDQPLLVQLQQHQANHRLHQIRMLAVRSLAVIGDYDTILESFHDESYRASWEQQLDLLLELIAGNTETASQVQRTLERQRGDDAKHLFRLLWGYDSDQLEAEGAGQLVQWLSHKALDIRVLSFLNLKRITGKTQLFMPEKPTGQQSTAIRAWQRLLEEGAILQQQEPTPWQGR